MPDPNSNSNPPAGNPAPIANPNPDPAPDAAAKGGAPDPRTWLPAEYHADPTFKDVQTVESLAKMYKHAQKFVGGEKVLIPGKDATKEEVEAFYKAVGRPEAADKYEVPKPKEGSAIEPSEDYTKRFFSAAFEAGLSKKQAAQLYQSQLDFAEAAYKENEALSEKFVNDTEQSLQKLWGDAKKQNIALATDATKHLAKTVFGDKAQEFIEWAKGRGLNNDAMFIRMMHHLGKELAEDDIPGGGATRGFVPTPHEARAELVRFDMDKDLREAYLSSEHPRHKEVVNLRKVLYEKAYPEAPPESAS